MTSHIALELIGALFIFVFLEHGIKRIGELSAHGLVEKNSLPIDDVIGAIQCATKLIRIQDTYMKMLVTNLDNRHKLERALTTALLTGSRVEILLLNPASRMAQQRASELRPDAPKELIGEIEQCLKLISGVRDNVLISSGIDPSRFSIKLYESAPSVALHQADDRIYWSFYPPTTLSSSGLQLLIMRRGLLSEFLEKRFESVWTQPTSVALRRDGGLDGGQPPFPPLPIG
jgi:hypothetical protein